MRCCETCRHWGAKPPSVARHGEVAEPVQGYARCLVLDDHLEAPAESSYGCDEAGVLWFETPAKFGCVHHENTHASVLLDQARQTEVTP